MATEIPDYEIRHMKKEDIPQVLGLWRETGLSEGTHSIDTWFEYDPEGFYIAVTSDGIVIGVCSGILQHSDLAFIGMYAVKSTFQRQGIGRKIWKQVMKRVGDRNAGLNSVPDMTQNYRDRAGFPIQTDWKSVVYVARELMVSAMVTQIPNINVRVVSPEDEETVNAVAEYDSDVYGFSRGRMISILCREEDSLTMAAFRENDNFVCGYGNIKQNIKGNAIIGPLHADDNSVAELIIYHLVEAFPVAKSNGVTLMTIDCNQDAIDMLERFGFLKRVDTPRLYKSEEVYVKFNKIFAQHNLNFSVF